MHKTPKKYLPQKYLQKISVNFCEKLYVMMKSTLEGKHFVRDSLNRCAKPSHLYQLENTFFTYYTPFVSFASISIYPFHILTIRNFPNSEKKRITLKMNTRNLSVKYNIRAHKKDRERQWKSVWCMCSRNMHSKKISHPSYFPL